MEMIHYLYNNHFSKLFNVIKTHVESITDSSFGSDNAAFFR